MLWAVFATTAALTISAESILDKGALRREDPALFSSIVMVLSGLMVLPFIWAVNWSWLTLPIFGWIALSSVVFACAFTFFIRALKKLELSLISPMSTLTPAIAALLAATFLSEPISGGQIAGITLLVFGGYFLQLKEGQDWFYPVQRIWQSCDLHYLFIALLLYPTFSIMGRYTFSHLHVEPYPYIIMIRLLTGIYFAAYLFTQRGGLKDIIEHVPRHKGVLFWVALLDTLNATMLVLALAATHAVRVLSLVRLSALFTTLIGGEIFHERNILKKTLACAVMVAGALWVAFG